MEHTAHLDHEKLPDTHHSPFAMTTFGFWVYLMTDCILFSILFATYAVLHNNTFGGPSSHDIFKLPYVLAETLILLTSSFLSGFIMLSAYKNEKNKVVMWLGVVFILGAAFVGMELKEFHHLVQEGFSWKRSGFLTSFFTLVGTHGTHISVGLLWILVMMGQIYFRGIKPVNLKRLMCFTMFWHFLDIIWIFIFTFVYLMGVV
jgi:cytochrome o ubiquinol oxidase subunit III